MENGEYPKVLVVSHNVFSQTSNMGKTMSSLFQGWDSNKLAQLYFHSEVPNDEICKNYYRVTDFDILEALFFLKKTGEVFKEKDIISNLVTSRVDDGIKSNIYGIGSKKKPYMYILRDLLWSTKKWESKKLGLWIDKFKPDVLFFFAGDYSFSINIAISISERKKIPLIVYFGDEYYFLNYSQKGMLTAWRGRKYKENFNNLFSRVNTFITATDQMKLKYETVFRKNGHTIMTPTNIEKVDTGKTNTEKKLIISYVGNLSLGRWESLLDLGRVLKRKGFVIEVYSQENDRNILSHLTLDNGILFKGSISAEEVHKVIRNSTLIIHVESMDPIMRDRVRYSLSTKIAESLGSGVCLIAYGPDDVSSMSYLIENNAAYVITQKQDLDVKIESILESGELRNYYINNAQKLANERHNFKENTKLLYNIISRSVGKSEDKNENSSNK